VSGSHVTLRTFADNELIFDEAETRVILKFFFQADSQRIDSANIDNRLRGFAQGLLVEAVDASYKLGYVKIIFDTVLFKPDLNLRKIIEKMAKKASRHWFKHATQKNLRDGKIYESV
jgi:hypothetical protein